MRRGSCDPLVLKVHLIAFQVFTKAEKTTATSDLQSLHNSLLGRICQFPMLTTGKDIFGIDVSQSFTLLFCLPACPLVHKDGIDIAGMHYYNFYKQKYIKQLSLGSQVSSFFALKSLIEKYLNLKILILSLSLWVFFPQDLK